MFDTLLLCTLGENEWEISLQLYDHRLRSHADTDEAFCDRVNCVAHEHKINMDVHTLISLPPQYQKALLVMP